MCTPSFLLFWTQAPYLLPQRKLLTSSLCCLVWSLPGRPSAHQWPLDRPSSMWFFPLSISSIHHCYVHSSNPTCPFHDHQCAGAEIKALFWMAKACPPLGSPPVPWSLPARPHFVLFLASHLLTPAPGFFLRYSTCILTSLLSIQIFSASKTSS